MTSFEILSDTVLTLSIVVESATAKALSLTTKDNTLDVLIAPCPAKVVEHLLTERIRLLNIRSQLKDTLDGFTNLSIGRRISTSTDIDISPDTSDALTRARILLSELLFGRESSILRSRLYATVLMRMSRVLFVNAESSLFDNDYLISLVESDVSNIRERLDMVQAEDAMKAVEEAERRGVDADIVRSVRVSAIIDAIGLLKESAEQRILDLFLSSESLQSTVQVQRSPSRASPISLGRSSSSESSLAQSLSLISNLYLSSIRELINDQLGTPERFGKISGQTGKMIILKFFIKDDKLFSNMLEPYLSLLQYECTPSPVLLPGTKFNSLQVSYQQMKNSISPTLSPASVRAYKDELQKLSNMVCLNDFLDWYGENVLLETHQWLARTLKQAWENKENRYNLPWDIDSVGHKSTLPETLATQIKVFLDLCTEEITVSTEASPAPLQTGGGSVTLKEIRLLKINAHIVTASARCFLLLAEEFKRTLQMKHWAEGQDAEERNQNGNFLIAIINDCFRTSNVHLGFLLQELVAEEATSEIGALVASATAAFNYVAEKSIAILVSVIFTDIEAMLLSFDSLWGTDTFVKEMVEPLKEYFRDIQTSMVPYYFQDLIIYSARSCVLRFLIFLRDRANRAERFKEDEIIRLNKDIAILKAAFTQNNPLLVDRLNETFCYLEELESLIRLDEYSQSSVQDQLRVYASRYQGESRQIPRAVLTCCLKLRVTSGPYHYSVVEGILGKDGSGGPTELSPERKERDITACTFEHDLFKKVFSTESISLDSVSHDARYLLESATKKSTGSVFSWFGGKEKASKASILVLRRQLDLEFGQAFEADEFGCITPEKADHDAKAVDSKSPDEDQVLIQISDLKVRGIATSAVFSKPNPYLVIECVGDRQKTETCFGNSEASWDGVILTFKVQRSKLLQTTKDTNIQLYVFDKEYLRRKVPLGSVRVNLAGIHVHDIVDWFALKGVGSNVNSSVHLNITLLDPKK